MTAQSVPDFEQLLREFREHHQRLRSLADRENVAEPTSSVDLIREIDEIGERMLVADEELRVQSEELASAQSNLTEVLSAYERLFMDAPVPYLQTDLDGVVVRSNRAAGQIIAASAARGSRTIVGLFRFADRGAIRDLLSQVRSDGPKTSLEHEAAAVEVHVQQPAGMIPVVVSAQLMVPGETAMVHWEVRPRATSAAPVAAPPDLDLVVALTTALREVAAAADLQEMANQLVSAGLSLIPGTAGCALAVRRARDRLEIAAASGPDARLITDSQRSLREGPAIDALRGGVPTRTASLGDDPRWPRLAGHQAELAVSSALAVPLVGPRGAFGALVCYAPQPAAFGTRAEALATSLSSQAALLYAARELEANLRAGMETRERIGQAVGVLMERHRLTSQQAFDLLVYVSQRTHRKLREIANWVTETGEDPHVFLKNAETV